MHFLDRVRDCLSYSSTYCYCLLYKVKKMWDELGSYNDSVCTCGVKNKRRKLMQFLIRLDESYIFVCGQLLFMNPLHDVSQTYSSIIQEEKKQNLVQEDKLFKLLPWLLNKRKQ